MQIKMIIIISIMCNTFITVGRDEVVSSCDVRKMQSAVVRRRELHLHFTPGVM